MSKLLTGMLAGMLLYLLFCTNPGRVVLAILVLIWLLMVIV